MSDMASNTNSSASRNDPIPDLSIRDLVAMATRQLKAISRKVPDGFCMEVRDYPKNLMSRVLLTRSYEESGGSNLKVEEVILKDDQIQFEVNMENLDHLYVTWDTPGMIAFCYSVGGRYTLINITHDRGVTMVTDIDRRERESETNNLTDQERRARANRRTFYHIGTMFDRAQLRDPDEDLEEDNDSQH